VPFHFDREMWNRLEEQQRERPPPPPSPTGDAESERARKDALRRAAALVYDSTPRTRRPAPTRWTETPPSRETIPPRRRQSRSGGFNAVRVEPRGDWRPAAADYAGRLQVVSDMTGSSTCEGTTADFAAYFRTATPDRQDAARPARTPQRHPIERVKAGARDLQVIAMVVETNTTKSGHKRIELEDESGAVMGWCATATRRSWPWRRRW